MTAFLAQLLTPVIYQGDERKMRHASSISLSLIGLFVSCGLSIPIFLLDGVTRFAIVLVACMGLVVSSFLYLLLYRGHVIHAGRGMLVLFYVFVTLTNIANGTVHAPASMIYLFIIIMAGDLFGWRGVLVSVTSISLTVLGLIVAENLGVLLPPNHALTFTNWFTYTLIFASLGVISYWGNYSMQKALHRAEAEVKERQRTEAALRTSEARFRALFEQKSDGVFIFGLNGYTQDANHRAAEMLGYTLDELRNGKGREFFAADDRSENSFARLLAGERIPLLERTLRTRDGGMLPVEINMELIRDAEGTPLHVQSIVRDISQRKQAEVALKRANEELQLRIAEVQTLQDELREQAIRDSLTELYNRRYLNETLGREIARAERENHSLCIIISDIDHFKKINDRHGHQTGDRFLQEVSRFINAHTRSSDVVCRYGGEEFLIIMPNTTLEHAEQRANEIREKCALLSITHGGQQLRATMSFGVAAFPRHGHVASEIINKADEALYISKKSGRNRVTVSP